jgi:ribosomal protein S4
MKGDTSENLIGLLERRLDAVVYRAKFVPTSSPRASSSTTATSW